MVIGERRSVQQNQRQSAGAEPIEQDFLAHLFFVQ